MIKEDSPVHPKRIGLQPRSYDANEQHIMAHIHLAQQETEIRERRRAHEQYKAVVDHDGQESLALPAPEVGRDSIVADLQSRAARGLSTMHRIPDRYDEVDELDEGVSEGPD